MTLVTWQKIIGVTIVAIAIATFFWWGDHFAVFDTKIDFLGRPLAEGGFYGCIVTGGFGVGYIFGGWRAGMVIALFTVVVFRLAILVGIAAGNYR